MSTAIVIPDHDLAEFAALPDTLKRDLGQWMQVIAEMLDAPKPVAKAASIAARFAHVKGFSRENILRRYYAFRTTGDWRALVNNAKRPRDAMRLPPEFVAEWQRRCLANQRAIAPAYRELVNDWRSGKCIPGYSTWRDYWRVLQPSITYVQCPTQLPPGWTYENLWRYRPSRFELTAARQGRAAAGKFRPKVTTTRVGLKVGQYFVFDDVEHDLLVNVIGTNRRAMRPLELGALDLFSACKFAYGTKPTLQDEIEDKKIKLKEREMRFLLAVVLTRHGYRADGTVMIVEHGTAAIRDDVEAALGRITNGAITVDRSGIQGKPACDAFFEGRPGGNPRFKAALESHWNLTHNETASLPGQLGRNRDNAPEQLHGQERYNTHLLNAMLALPADRRDLLKFDILRYDIFCELYAQIVDHINRRTDHDLEGWEKAGLLTTEFEIAPGLPPITDRQLRAMPEDKQLALRGAITPVRTRKLSPWEVWQDGQAELVRLPPWSVTEILGEDLSREQRLGADGIFEFEDRDLGPGAHRFLGVVHTPDGRRVKLIAEETYLTFCNPFAGDSLIVCSATKGRGGVLGIAPRWTEVSRADLDAVHRRMGEVKALEKESLLPVARAGAAIARELLDKRRHNAEVAGGEPITIDERRSAMNLRNFEPVDLVEAATPEPAQPADPSDASDKPDDFDASTLL